MIGAWRTAGLAPWLAFSSLLKRSGTASTAGGESRNTKPLRSIQASARATDDARPNTMRTQIGELAPRPGPRGEGWPI